MKWLAYEFMTFVFNYRCSNLCRTYIHVPYIFLVFDSIVYMVVVIVWIHVYYPIKFICDILSISDVETSQYDV